MWRSVALVTIATLLATHALAATIAAGGSHSFAVKDDGTVRAWGDDSQGRLGLGRKPESPVPLRVTDLAGFTAVSAGADHVVALGSDGTVWTWGSNSVGQLGLGTTAQRTVPGPNRVPGLTDIVAIDAGAYHTVALKSDGSLWAWGHNIGGEVGDGTRTDRFAPTRVTGLDGVIAFSVGWDHTIALKADGTIWTWGGNLYWQRGHDGQAPAPIEGLAGVVAVAAGSIHSLALLDDGTVVEWGYRCFRFDCTPFPGPHENPTLVPGLRNVVAIAAGGRHSLALRSDGTAWSWGENDHGQLCDASTIDRSRPGPVDGLAGVDALVAGHDISIFRLRGGAFRFCGRNHDGQLGDGSFTDRLAPVEIPAMAEFVSFGAGYGTTVAIGREGSVWAWGDNSSGQLADGQRIERVTPTEIPGFGGVVATASVGWFSLAVKSDGTVWSWGTGGQGELGDGTTTRRLRPGPVGGLTNIIAVAAGGNFGLALKSDGSVWGWGRNGAGELGDGTTVERSLPAPVVGLGNVVAISAGSAFAAAVKSDGTVWTWGRGFATPVQVPGIADVVGISTSGDHTLAFRRDGTLWAWGGNFNGELGDGTRAARTEPIQVRGIGGVVAVSASYLYSVAVKSDGTVWEWGRDWRTHQPDRLEPVQVRGLAAIVEVASDIGHSIARKSDGTVWTWGENRRGELGDGTFATRGAPVVVVREGGAGSVEANDWYLDLRSGYRSEIPFESRPAFLISTSGSVNTDTVGVTAEVKFRARDVGKNIHVFAYAPASIVKGLKADAPTCVLSQLDASGSLQATSASSLQPYVANVVSSEGQTVRLLDNVLATQVSGATFCLGTGTSGTDSTEAANSRCAATVPGSTICLPPGASPPVSSAASLENPAAGSFQSGIGLISGWSCRGPVTITVDDSAPVAVPHGSSRADTASVCGSGNIDTGFGLLVNFNNFGAGSHRIQLFVDGVASASPSTFTVTVPAGEFLTGATKALEISDFPGAGRNARLVWQQSLQNFSIQCVRSGPGDAECAAPDVTPGASPNLALENPMPGSFQSGIGLISGWSCEGPVDISIDGNARVTVPYGSPRADTAGVCGTGNIHTGFGLLVNFNLLGPGIHAVQLHVKGTARGNPARFRVTVPSGEFMSGIMREASVPDFPTPGRTTTLIWQQSLQNFSIRSVSP